MGWGVVQRLAAVGGFGLEGFAGVRRVVVADVDEEAAAARVDGVKLVILRRHRRRDAPGCRTSHRHVRPSSAESQTPIFCRRVARAACRRRGGGRRRERWGRAGC